ncbi:hypothetical protein KBK24_0123450 [Burkholderia sp. K24]|jgi:hypothetical protein|uniref:Uncharacterized protein n=1 Tax=Paraburkholderia fungorum TaxID=134537 RepID=A0AAW3VBF8_9BURK|nr:hypothetical protein KBK24_0123450 [Burkholderia sp. K24]MBB4519792.1 hypothetical protein [Paraburkholderia fungorum]MBB6207462.1 hypothetical protein [Paraburkholderia fungorum]
MKVRIIRAGFSDRPWWPKGEADVHAIDADLATKERALEKLAPTDATSLRFKPTDSVLAFLQQL